jgi:hypothetical protein
MAQIAAQLGVGRATLYRHLNSQRLRPGICPSLRILRSHHLGIQTFGGRTRRVAPGRTYRVALPTGRPVRCWHRSRGSDPESSCICCSLRARRLPSLALALPKRDLGAGAPRLAHPAPAPRRRRQPRELHSGR